MDRIYLNNAATSWPKAPGLAEVMASSIAAIPGHPGRSGLDIPDPERHCREQLARLFQVADPDRLILAANATHALNMALHGLGLGQGDLVLTSMAEHNAVLRPLHYLEKHCGIRIATIPVDDSGRIRPDAWARALFENRPKLAVMNHASNVTGAINDLPTLAGLAHDAGAIVLVDASQTAGLVDLAPQAWGVDMLAFTGHKYLLGPLGTGGLYLGPNVSLEPVLTGGTGVLGELREMPEEMPFRYEVGTPNSTAFAGLAHAIEWSSANPPDRDGLERRLERLAEGLASAGARLVPWNGSHTPVISFVLPDIPVEDVGEMLELSFGIVCRIGLHCAPLVHQAIGTAGEGTVRLSLSRFTTDDEVEQAIAAIRSIAG